MYIAHLAEYTEQCAVSDSAQVNAARSQDPVQANTARSQTIFFCLHLLYKESGVPMLIFRNNFEYFSKTQNLLTLREV